ncbi:hypothetical protein F2Q68_00021747 [Brassica cretica]|uniref:Uncharacterized protein n=1 Tax=Brassica cretica TaxID=69181 RepID=A0A8S9FPY0_BRACR|nr:hypothetical protein F2Q68_00021747 [Brassica cretica]
MKRGFLGHSKKEPAGLCTIRKSTREVSIDTLQAEAIDSVHHQSIDTRQTTTIDRANQPDCSIDTVHPSSIDTIHPPSIDTVHPPSIDTVHPGTVHPDTVYLVKNDTTCGETEKIEVLILKVEGNEMLRDEEGRIRNSA